MRQTKIVATLGPASGSPAQLPKLLAAGVNVVRLNFSHGTYAEMTAMHRAVRQWSKQHGQPIAILQDLQGPKVRVGQMQPGTILKTGATVELTTKSLIGDHKTIPLGYKRLPRDVTKGDTLLLDDGLLELRVLRTTTTSISARVIHGGPLTSHKGINVPSTSLSIPAITPKDVRDLNFGATLGVDYVALSFVKTAADITSLRRRLARAGSTAKIIAKIEKHEAVDNLDSILQATDGVMVARGDLGVELDPAEVPLIQKRIIHAANALYKPVITATQMLESMVAHPRATRAEISDVANAVLDGTDAVMLSAESASGQFPVEAVQTMARTAQNAEQFFSDRPIRGHRVTNHNVTTEAVSIAACEVANDVSASLMVVPTASGWSARAVSRHRVNRPIVALTSSEQTARELCLVWGVQPFVVPKYRSVEVMVKLAKEFVITNRFAKRGEKMVITAGLPLHQPGQTTTLQVHTV